jgi:hypothetical protein
MARVPKMARGDIYLARSIQCCPNFFFKLLLSPKPYFGLQNLHGHEKGFLRNLYTIWPRALLQVYQPWYRRNERRFISREGGMKNENKRRRYPGFARSAFL